MIRSDPKYNGYERGLASTVYKFFDKKSSDNGVKSILPLSIIFGALVCD